MQARKLSVGIGVVAMAMTALALMPATAYADYAPSSNDVVGVGSDTLQAGIDFVADGDHLGDSGYNAGKRNKFISIDATADANTRLAYSPQGVSDNSATACAPGTGAKQGTGNQNTNHKDQPCVLNPTVVLRSGTSPILRPNGSGAGYNLLKADTDTGTGLSKFNLVDFARRSSQAGANALFDSIQFGNDPLGMLTSVTTHATKTLSVAQLKSIYNCTLTDWGVANGGAATGQPIKPLIPQLGSGTRSYFLGAIGLTEGTLGTTCGITAVEENDPEAIDASSDPINAIEPMSQSRLFLFQGKTADGTLAGSPNGVGGYFHDSSCVGLSSDANCPQTTQPAGTAGALTYGPVLAPNVKLWTTADPAPSDGTAAFFPTRPLYVYFRHADIASTKAFQPGDSRNWVKTMLYNPGGPTPYLCNGTGQALIAASGITPVSCVYTPGGP
jgi:ABC-type phosphate transport system substrate-binding protein